MVGWRVRSRSLVIVALLLAGCEWTGYLGGPAHTSASPDGRVHLTDVPALASRWRWHPEDLTGRPGALFATPATWRGRVFVGANNGNFVALDVATGAQLWKRDFGFQPQIGCNASGVVASTAVRGDAAGHALVYVNAPDGYLYELNGQTGATVWRSVVKIPSTTVNDAFSWSSPTLANGRVYVGISSNCDTPFVRGAVVAYDQVTGARLATGWTMPAGFVGAGVWTSVAADANAVYVTTGSTTPQIDAAHPSTPTNQYDQYSMLKLDPKTLAVVGKWSAPMALVGDPDFGSSPILFDASIGGMKTQLVGACNKDGVFYVLRTDTMKLVWKRQVGTAEVAGEVACLSGGVSDGTRLFVGANGTTIRGVAVPGSVRRLNPATGAVIWETGLLANPLGSGTINANGILAYAGTDWNMGGGNGVYLIDGATGRVLRVLKDVGEYPEFAQPIWAEGHLFAANSDAVVSWSP